VLGVGQVAGRGRGTTGFFTVSLLVGYMYPPGGAGGGEVAYGRDEERNGNSLLRFRHNYEIFFIPSSWSKGVKGYLRNSVRDQMKSIKECGS
jgi:hypothetical protein